MAAYVSRDAPRGHNDPRPCHSGRKWKRCQRQHRTALMLLRCSGSSRQLPAVGVVQHRGDRSVTLAPYAGWIYGACAGGLGAWFLVEAHRLRSRVATGEAAAPMRLFHLSIAYLTLLFALSP